MHAVIETSVYLRNARAAGLTPFEMAEIADEIANNPHQGEIIRGSGGARKVRFARKGKGKRGGYRTIHYYAADDVPIFILALIDKGERENISRAELNEMRTALSGLADAYRQGVRSKVIELRGRR